MQINYQKLQDLQMHTNLLGMKLRACLVRDF